MSSGSHHGPAQRVTLNPHSKKNLGALPQDAENWFPNLSSAISSIEDPEYQLVVAWDKPDSASPVKKKGGSKAYALYRDHSTFWSELDKLPRNERFAYEIVRPQQACKAYWDIEFVKDVSPQEKSEAFEEVRLLMKDWILCLKLEFRKLFKSATEDVKVAVLDGTRDVGPSRVKFSFHVIVVNYAFEGNKSEAFRQLRDSLPTLHDLCSIHTRDGCRKYGPSQQDKCAPDVLVWKDNQAFRILSCSKRGSSTPLTFFDPLTDTKNPLDTFLTHLRHGSAPLKLIRDEEVEQQADEQKKKKRKMGSSVAKRVVASQSVNHEETVRQMLQKYPQELENIHEQVQELLKSWGDCNTQVHKLVRASKHLRYQCKNIVNRPCLFTTENHESNTPIIWLDAPRDVSEGQLSNHYQVTYICKSVECQCHGVIGEIFSVGDDKDYEFSKTFPPIMRTCPAHSDLRHQEQPASPEPEAPNLVQQKDLVREKIHGWGWTEEEQRVYGVENMYESVKKRFEEKTCFIESPSVIYLRFHDPSKNLMDYDHYSYESMQRLEKSLFYYKKEEQHEPPVLARFFPAWTDDPTIRKYNRIIFDPSKPPLYVTPEENHLNVWPGIQAARLPHLSEEFSEQELSAPIARHVLNVLANGNEEHCEWILDWMANIVKRPHVKTQVPIVISGKQGVGKGIIFDFFREKILGLSISSQIQNPAQDLFSRFSNSHVNKIFLQIDEGDGLSKFADHLKNLVTADKVHFEVKGLTPDKTSNYINIVITTNHERPVLVETSDRRYVLFKASDVHLSEPNYYQELAAHLKRPEVARAFYDFLCCRDIEEKYPDHFQASRPVTEYYKESRKISIPIVQRFLSAVVNSRKYAQGPAAAEVSASVFFKDFLQYVEVGRFQTCITSCKFGTLLKNVRGLSTARKQRGNVYLVDHDQLRSHLIQNHEFDEDAIFD